jgi:hypothetical protein
MSGLKELATEPDPGRGPKCVVAKMKETRPDVYEDLVEILGHESVTAARISKRLEEYDPPIYIHQNRLTYHRRGDCKCGRETS